MALVVCMALLLVGLGFVIGEAIEPGLGVLGVIGAGVLWFILTIVAYFQGDSIMLASVGARKIEKKDHPRLFNIVEEMTIASGLGKMPNVYIIEEQAPNAFAIGRNPDKASVAITTGLLKRLNRDQLQGVMAHEIAHIQNRDVLFMTLLGVMLGAIVIISQVFLRGMFYSSMAGGRRYQAGGGGRGRGGGNQAQAIMMIVAIVLAILAPILARLLYLASSRKREYLADASAAVYTRYPEGLAQALEVISKQPSKMEKVNSAVAPMFIVNPLQKMSARGLFSTHPPTEERIKALRSMGGRVSYEAYQRALEQTTGGKARLPASALAGEAQEAREASPEDAGPKEARHRAREAGDLLRKVNQYVFLACACGLRMKLPPDFKDNHVDCPRCHRNVAVPKEQLAAAAAIGGAMDAQGRKSKGEQRQSKGK